MIDPSLLRAVTKVVAHAREEAPCPDGLAAALIVRDALPAVEVRFVAYESEELARIAAEPGLLFLDISPPADRLAEFFHVGTLVLDHHDTVRADVERFVALERGVFGSEPGVSAAVLAFRHIWEPLATDSHVQPLDRERRRTLVARFAELAGIYDTWQRGHADWESACDQTAALYHLPAEAWLGDGDPIAGDAAQIRLDLGAALRRADNERTRRLARDAYRFVTLSGKRVAVVTSTAGVSLAADAIDDVDAVVGFAFAVRAGVPSMKLSFRSRADGVVVRGFAEALGGGGHDRAASAWVELHTSHRHPFAVIRQIMEVW